MRRVSLLMLLFLPLLAGGAATAHDGKPVPGKGSGRDGATAAELIEARKAMMHMAATLAFESVMPAVRNGTDVKLQEHAAESLAYFGHSIGGLFPAGSHAPDSRAAPAIWTNKADFDARAKSFGDASARLAELAKAGDSTGFAAQAKVVAGGCNSCHSRYRTEEPAKVGGHKH
jgi:cytochrome c556